MSRRIFKRRSGVITGDLLQDPVADIAALRLIAARDVDDGQLILVRSVNRIFSFAYGDVTSDDGMNVIAPTYDSTVGRWKRIEFAGGGSGDFADKWVDVTKIPSGETVTVDAASADDVPKEVNRQEIDVDGTLDVVDGYVVAGERSLGETLGVYNQTQGNDVFFTTGDEIVGETDVVLRATGSSSNIELYPGASGEVLVSGKLNVTGLIDPTGIIFTEAGTPTVTSTEGALYVSDGSDGLTQNSLVYVDGTGTATEVGSGGGGSSASSEYTGTAGENLATGELIYFSRGASTEGQLMKALGTSIPNSDIVGVAKASATTGNSAVIYTGGSVPVLFGTTPSSSDNGARVYLDPSTSGVATLTAPTGVGESVVLVGRLTGADGLTSTPTVLLSISHLYSL